MSKQQQVLKQELTVSQILRTYGKQFKQIQMQILMGIMADALWVLSCRTLGGTVKMIPEPLKNYWAH